MSQFSRTISLVGEEKMDRLRHARVAVFGIGGVGGYVVEALARSGIGALDLIDHDKVALSNLNRQIIALHSTIGLYKADVARDRVLDINPECNVTVHRAFFLPETADRFDFAGYDYVVDAIDTVSGKIELILKAQSARTPVISCMGAGNKLDPSAFRVADIYSTNVCPLAKVMRRELKKRGVKKLKVVYSEEKPLTPAQTEPEASVKTGTEDNQMGQKRRQTPGSMSFVPGAAGLVLAGEVIRDLMEMPSQSG